MKTVRVRFLRTTGMGNDGVVGPGDELDVTQALAQELVGNGRAEYIKGKLYESTPDEPEEKVEVAAVEPPEKATATVQRSEPARRKP